MVTCLGPPFIFFPTNVANYAPQLTRHALSLVALPPSSSSLSRTIREKQNQVTTLFVTSFPVIVFRAPPLPFSIFFLFLFGSYISSPSFMCVYVSDDSDYNVAIGIHQNALFVLFITFFNN